MLEEALPAIRKTVEQDPKRIDMQQDLARTHKYLGDALLQLWEPDAAVKEYEKARVSLEALSQANLHLPLLRRDLADIYEALANVSTARAARSRSSPDRKQHWTDTRNWYLKSQAIWANWNRYAKSGVMDQARREKLKRAIERCDQAIRELR
jgi:tetratricopeptide (TPR) repeat protein